MKNEDSMIRKTDKLPQNLLMELCGVSKTLDGKKVLNGVNVQIPRNRIVGLIGGNGQGKSTLLKLMAGIWKADAGEITRHTQHISYLMPRDVFYQWMRVKDAVQFYTLHYQRFRTAKAWELIRDAGFDEKALIWKLSDGQRERLMLILALSVEAELYLLDVNWGKVLGCV